MQTQSHVALGIQDPQTEGLLVNEGGGGVPSPSLVAANNQQPAKKPPRQWAAWTRQEEENFFNALRQVGKNFEKITIRVRSKTKNQVRHYYYRLVRRMNRLLGPGVCLDAKNSKDTNAAMLRWWSLLEKHSCTASKLHLKPRRFKMFLEALESQLLKDRNKSKRKRPCQGEKYLSAASAIAIPNKAVGIDGPVVDIQNGHKMEANKGTSVKRNSNVNISFSKGALPPAKPVKQKRRAGLVATAAYRRWEKAAMAGVSLVADAAEQLERGTGTKDVDSLENDGGHLCCPPPMGMCSPQPGIDVIQLPVKLKLQLFPVDEVTRQALEKDECNPHLELTLSCRKKISSVLEHLNRKWGNSSIASGELVLLPYNIQQEDASQYRWTSKDNFSAADVYATVGSPAVFRLRYGWFSSAEPMTGIVQGLSPKAQHSVTMCSEDLQEGFDKDFSSRAISNCESPCPALLINHMSEKPIGSSKDGIPENAPGDHAAEATDEFLDSSGLSPSPWDAENTRDRYCSERHEVTLRNFRTVSAGDWADSLTNISIGDLLSEASKAANSCCLDSSLGKNAPCLQENLSCDSFDAAIAAHISAHQSSIVSTQAAPSSMWNAEETCDGFSFRAVSALKNQESPLSYKQPVNYGSAFQGCFKELPNHVSSSDPSYKEPDTELTSANDISDNKEKDTPEDTNLMDNYWSDSLGPLDLDVPASSRYQGQDLVFGDSNSFGFLSRMIANSLDAFHNLSFFGIDKKESPPGEAQGASVHLDTKSS